MGLAKPFYSKYTQHGIDHEQDAIHDFEAKYGGNVVKCGAFISRKYPFLLASPDGIYGDNLIEVKCPYILAETTPWDLKSLKKPQRQRHFCESTGNGRGIALKRSHKYFAQVQMAMLVTGFRNTVFIVQTPNDVTKIDVPFEEDYATRLLEQSFDKFKKVFIPEYFEMKYVRGLKLLDL